MLTQLRGLGLDQDLALSCPAYSATSSARLRFCCGCASWGVAMRLPALRSPPSNSNWMLQDHCPAAQVGSSFCHPLHCYLCIPGSHKASSQVIRTIEGKKDPGRGAQALFRSSKPIRIDGQVISQPPSADFYKQEALVSVHIPTAVRPLLICSPMPGLSAGRKSSLPFPCGVTSTCLSAAAQNHSKALVSVIQNSLPSAPQPQSNLAGSFPQAMT